MKYKNIAFWLIPRSDTVRRLIKTLVLTCLFLQSIDDAFPCSAIFRQTDNDGRLLGGNFDWNARGGIVYLSPRSQIKSSQLNVDAERRPARWVSRYASLALSQFGRDYPMQGMNEMGLAGVVLMAPAKYPATGSAGDITENLWLQYQLDQFATVHEVALHVSDFGIRKISADLHWMLCDKTGECAVIEFLEGRAHIYRSRDEQRNILTNSPYALAWQSYIDWSSSNRPLPQGYQSLARFTRLAFSQIHPNPTGLESELDDVSLPGFTAWQTVFHISQRSLKVRLEGGLWEYLSFGTSNLNCRQNLPIYQLGKGSWALYDSHVVRELLERATAGVPRDEVSLILEAIRRSEHVVCANPLSEK